MIYKRGGCNKDGVNGACSKCGKRRKCGKYWVKFQHRGKMVYRSTGHTSLTKARKCETKLKSELANGNFGILQQRPALTLAEFLKQRIEPWARARSVWPWYWAGIRPLLQAKSIAGLPLDEVNSEVATGFAAHRQVSVAVGTVNRELRVLRRALRLAVEWGLLTQAPKIQMLKGEKFRERVVGDEEFERYLLHTSPLLADVATVLHDTGLRPDEAHRLDWADISFVNGRHGKLRVRYGKTDSARRELPLTPRLRNVLEARWQNAGRLECGWVFPAPTRAGHINHSSLKKQHSRALRMAGVPPFLLYSLRHSFATRIAPGVDAWTLCKVMGWSSLSVAMRYIHPSEERVLAAFAETQSNGSGDKIRDSHANTAFDTGIAGALSGVVSEG